MRMLSLHQKVILLNVFLLSKIWYIAANLAPTTAHIAKVTATMRRYLFRGIIATVPMAQLARRMQDGELNLHLPAMKCKALLINRHIRDIDSLPFYESYLNQANRPRANISELPCLKQMLDNIPILPFQIRQNPSADLVYRFFVKGTDRPTKSGSSKQ